MDRLITCLVTIHGIGFQQAPVDGLSGYADGLHEALRRHLPDLLSGDPAAEFGRPAGEGAIYVHSDWPPDTRQSNSGLGRLGSWKTGDLSHRQIDITGVPLADVDHPLAHIALVYSHLEDQGPHIGATMETLEKAVIAHGRYATVWSVVRMGVLDIHALLQHRGHAADGGTPSLRVRTGAPVRGGNPAGLAEVVQQLDHDVTTYVVRNDLRERVRSFVHDALLRLACRPDVGQIVVNAHSQGTVLAFDAIRELPPFATARMPRFITAGSPLRKYVDLFYWGADAGPLSQTQWINFWDRTDPVADPLAPPVSWRLGDDLPPATGVSELFVSTDPETGGRLDVRLTDMLVSNADHGVGGGLPAHNYWDNDQEFVGPLCDVLRTIV